MYAFYISLLKKSHENDKSSELESTITNIYLNISYVLPISTAVLVFFASGFDEDFTVFLRKNVNKKFIYSYYKSFATELVVLLEWS